VLSQQAQAVLSPQQAFALSQQAFVQVESTAAATSSAAFSAFLEEQLPQDTAATIRDATARDINTFFITD
jgi:hypothetical protein